MNNVRVVLVETSHSGNIGAAARAMKTMGLDSLHLVNPLVCIDQQAVVRASGAQDVLERAQIHASLEAATGDCVWVVGASARLRSLPWPVLDPRQCVNRLLGIQSDAPVAVVFGREKSGLSNRELEHCNALMHIPTDASFQSLNIAAAVQVFAYELRMGVISEPVTVTPKDPLASVADVSRFYEHLQTVLLETGFLDPDNPRQVMRRLIRLFNRCDLERVEVNILRGILAAVQNKRNRGDSAG